jgi:hypothetical protein
VKDNKIFKTMLKNFTRRTTWKLCGEDKELENIFERGIKWKALNC